MSVEIAWKQNILVTDFQLLKSLLVALGFGSQAFVCGFSRQNINSVGNTVVYLVVLCMFFQSNMANWWEITDVTIRPIGISVQFSHRPPSQILRQSRDPGPPGQSCPPRKSSFMGTIRLKNREFFSNISVVYHT